MNRPAHAEPLAHSDCGELMLLALTPNPAVDKTVLLDRLDVAAVHRSGEVHACPGGKGNNVARIAKLLGMPVRVGGILGGFAGEWMIREYRREGFDLGAFAWTQQETRTCVILVERGQGRATVINEEGPQVAPQCAAQWADIVATVARGCDWTAVCGSLAPGAGPEHYLPLLRSARSAGSRVAVDTSGAWLATSLRAHPDLVRVNELEAGSVLGTVPKTLGDAADAAQSLRTLGAGCAVVSLGALGCAAADASGRWLIEVPQVEVVSPIGAGDTMLAGILWSLGQGEAFAEAVRRGAALATAKCLIAGSSRVSLDDYRALLPRTVCRPV